MNKYIEKEAVGQTVLELPCKVDDDGYIWVLRRDAFRAVDDFPAADVRENVKAHWARKHDDVCYWSECSSCGERLPLNQWRQEWDSPFCPNCGAQMEVQDG